MVSVDHYFTEKKRKMGEEETTYIDKGTYSPQQDRLIDSKY